jgi:hypothetical protein
LPVKNSRNYPGREILKKISSKNNQCLPKHTSVLQVAFLGDNKVHHLGRLVWLCRYTIPSTVIAARSVDVEENEWMSLSIFGTASLLCCEINRRAWRQAHIRQRVMGGFQLKFREMLNKSRECLIHDPGPHSCANKGEGDGGGTVELSST